VNNVRLELRLLAHSIDAATLSTVLPHRPGRRRRHQYGPATSIALLLAALAALAFGFH
jgi:hypothetical protein